MRKELPDIAQSPDCPAVNREIRAPGRSVGHALRNAVEARGEAVEA